ncbi:MAG: GNAT family N-acetyltransferase [Kutzneria sp.]|nr:GNAT family N-acetyltransferase [Kutzneria sp.]
MQLPAAVLHALAIGDLLAANQAAPVVLTPYFVTPEWRGTWRRRSNQVAADPTAASWITRAIVDTDLMLAVGCAGYHGPPDATGMVEVGYAVDPAHRRKGYARAALELLLERARHEPSVRTVRASVRPDNTASLRLVAQYGFLEVGTQWDEEDGLETVFEVAVSSPR